MKDKVVATRCPVCAHPLAVNFFDGGKQPLATLGWPDSQETAQSMQRYSLDFMQCPACSHVWNRSFEYEEIPYRNNPNRMFNSGGIWNEYLSTARELIINSCPPSPVVVEIGCGEGRFVGALADESKDTGRFIGFDPNASGGQGGNIEFYPRLFDPMLDFEKFSPDIVMIRHVLEHFSEPAKFIDELACAATTLGKRCLLFAEAPCIDRVFETGRLADFYYEHVSHFTTRSFTTLLNRAGEIQLLDHGYDREVIFALVTLGMSDEMLQSMSDSVAFHSASQMAVDTISQQLQSLATTEKTIAIWGGTGKAAAFMNLYGADAERFPLVVESDPDKVGSFVPGCGQEIVFRDQLKGQSTDIVIIPTQWRARDIVAEMSRESIVAEQVLIEHQGRLVDYHNDEHPYAK